VVHVLCSASCWVDRVRRLQLGVTECSKRSRWPAFWSTHFACNNVAMQQFYSYLAQYSIFVNILGAHTMLGTVIIFYRFTLLQQMYACTQTNLRWQIRGWSETTLILTNESQPNIARLIRVDQSQGSKLSRVTDRQSTDRQVDFMTTSGNLFIQRFTDCIELNSIRKLSPFLYL
jgi:hypothetical protein